MTVGNTDFIQPFAIEGLGFRARLVRLGPALCDILSPRAFPVAVARFMSEALALGATPMMPRGGPARIRRIFVERRTGAMAPAINTHVSRNTRSWIERGPARPSRGIVRS